MYFPTIITLLPALALAMPNNLIQERQSLEAITDQLLFSDSMAQFQAARNAQNPPQLDWSSDGCSDSPDDPFGFDFLDSCERHDFGYRNYKAQGRFAAGKASIDSNFKKDMDNQCSTYELTSACDGVAEVYYEAVVEFGSKKRTVEEKQ
jgi:hypothetical protein